MAFKTRRNEIRPRNERMRQAARESVASLTELNRQHNANALFPNGMPCVVYTRLFSGRQCSCAAGRSDVLDVDGNLDEAQIEALTKGEDIRIEAYSSHQRTDTGGVYTIIENPNPTNKYENFDLKSYYHDQHDSDYVNLEDGIEDDVEDENLDSVIMGVESVSCAVCFGTGYAGGYDLYSGKRIVLDTTFPKVSVTGIIDSLVKPNKFVLEPRQSITFTNVPLIHGNPTFTVYNNNKIVESLYVIEVLHDGEWIASDDDRLGWVFDGRCKNIRIRSTKNLAFTHIELLIFQQQEPLLLDFAKFGNSFAANILDNTASGNIVLPARMEYLPPLSVVYNIQKRSGWVITSIEPTESWGNQSLALEAATRKVQEYELYSLLRSPPVLYDVKAHIQEARFIEYTTVQGQIISFRVSYSQPVKITQDLKAIVKVKAYNPPYDPLVLSSEKEIQLSVSEDTPLYAKDILFTYTVDDDSIWDHGRIDFSVYRIIGINPVTVSGYKPPTSFSTRSLTALLSKTEILHVPITYEADSVLRLIGEIMLETTAEISAFVISTMARSLDITLQSTTVGVDSLMSLLATVEKTIPVQITSDALKTSAIDAVVTVSGISIDVDAITHNKLSTAQDTTATIAVEFSRNVVVDVTLAVGSITIDVMKSGDLTNEASLTVGTISIDVGVIVHPAVDASIDIDGISIGSGSITNILANVSINTSVSISVSTGVLLTSSVEYAIDPVTIDVDAVQYRIGFISIDLADVTSVVYSSSKVFGSVVHPIDGITQSVSSVENHVREASLTTGNVDVQSDSRTDINVDADITTNVDVESEYTRNVAESVTIDVGNITQEAAVTSLVQSLSIEIIAVVTADVIVQKQASLIANIGMPALSMSHVTNNEQALSTPIVPVVNATQQTNTQVDSILDTSVTSQVTILTHRVFEYSIDIDDIVIQVNLSSVKVVDATHEIIPITNVYITRNILTDNLDLTFDSVTQNVTKKVNAVASAEIPLQIPTVVDAIRRDFVDVQHDVTAEITTEVITSRMMEIAIDVGNVTIKVFLLKEVDITLDVGIITIESDVITNNINSIDLTSEVTIETDALTSASHNLLVDLSVDVDANAIKRAIGETTTELESEITAVSRFDLNRDLLTDIIPDVTLSIVRNLLETISIPVEVDVAASVGAVYSQDASLTLSNVVISTAIVRNSVLEIDTEITGDVSTGSRTDLVKSMKIDSSVVVDVDSVTGIQQFLDISSNTDIAFTEVRNSLLGIDQLIDSVDIDANFILMSDISIVIPLDVTMVVHGIRNFVDEFDVNLPTSSDVSAITHTNNEINIDVTVDISLDVVKTVSVQSSLTVDTMIDVVSRTDIRSSSIINISTIDTMVSFREMTEDMIDLEVIPVVSVSAVRRRIENIKSEIIPSIGTETTTHMKSDTSIDSRADTGTRYTTQMKRHLSTTLRTFTDVSANINKKPSTSIILGRIAIRSNSLSRTRYETASEIGRVRIGSIRVAKHSVSNVNVNVPRVSRTSAAIKKIVVSASINVNVNFAVVANKQVVTSASTTLTPTTRVNAVKHISVSATINTGNITIASNAIKQVQANASLSVRRVQQSVSAGIVSSMYYTIRGSSFVDNTE